MPTAAAWRCRCLHCLHSGARDSTKPVSCTAPVPLEAAASEPFIVTLMPTVPTSLHRRSALPPRSTQRPCFLTASTLLPLQHAPIFSAPSLAHPTTSRCSPTRTSSPCSFRLGRQEDAHEFLIALLDAMHEASIAHMQPKPPPEVAHTSFIYRIFGGRMRSQVGMRGVDRTCFWQCGAWQAGQSFTRPPPHGSASFDASLCSLTPSYSYSPALAHPPACSLHAPTPARPPAMQVKCSECGYESNTYDPCIDLSLEITRAQTVKRALERFTAGGCACLLTLLV